MDLRNMLSFLSKTHPLERFYPCMNSSSSIRSISLVNSVPKSLIGDLYPIVKL